MFVCPLIFFGQTFSTSLNRYRYHLIYGFVFADAFRAPSANQNTVWDGKPLMTLLAPPLKFGLWVNVAGGQTLSTALFSSLLTTNKLFLFAWSFHS
jgi:hypothetical protein